MAAFATSRRINTAATCAGATVNSGGATLAVGAVSVVAVYVSEAQGAAWVRDCSH